MNEIIIGDIVNIFEIKEVLIFDFQDYQTKVDLIEAVHQSHADLGIAFDGDGDRLGVVSNLGEIIFPDQLLMIFAQDVLSRNKGAQIIFDVKCSNLLVKTIEEAGGKPYMSATGHFHIKNALKQSGAPLAGEMSGHIFFNDKWYGFDDGPYSAVRAAEILVKSDDSISDIFSRFPNSFSTPELNINVTDENKFEIVKKFISGSRLNGEKITIDGLRVNFDNGWGLLRASNTTPNLVLRFEGDSFEAMNQIQDEFISELSRICPEIDINLN